MPLHDVSPGSPGDIQLVYRYTVAGSDKASIDTGVDTPNAGSNDWTNGDLLEIFLVARTDEAVNTSQLDLIFNNDTGAVYDRAYIQMANTSVISGGDNADTALQFGVAGASEPASIAAARRIVIPNYTGVSFFKTGECFGGDVAEGTSRKIDWIQFNYRSTSAITRLKVAPDTGGKLLKVGTQLLIYKRLAS